MTTENTRNMAHVTYIAKTLEQVADGVFYTCPECGEWIEPTFEENTDGNTLTCPKCGHVTDEGSMDPVSMYDYFSDVHNIEYRLDSNREYKSIQLMVACGGPNIYIDTATKKVELYWWSERATAHLPDYVAAAIDEFGEELYNC